MTEPAAPALAGEPHRTQSPPSTWPPVGSGDLGSTGMDGVQAACRALGRFGTWAGWGLSGLGILAATVDLAQFVRAESHESAGLAAVLVRMASEVLALGLAGWGVATISRLVATSIGAYLEQMAGLSFRMSSHAAHALVLLERIAEALAERTGPVVSTQPTGLLRAQAVAEIVQAQGAGDWSLAQTRLTEFAGAFPDDPELSAIEENLEQARDTLIRDSLAQLDAARGVSDPDRVIELFQAVVPALEAPQRASLEQDLAGWFLNLIHRRLRTGKIQKDVVELAARFAENFAATVEGASVRASLPTLRRSVGLCPRCGQPYTGLGDACPRCKSGGAPAVASAAANDESYAPEYPTPPEGPWSQSAG